MSFLSGCARATQYNQVNRSQPLRVPTSSAEQGDRLKALFPRSVEGGCDIGGVSAGAEDDHQITGSPQTFDLAGENRVEAEIVADAGEQ